MTIDKKIIIRTERLILRQWKIGDFAPFAKMNADPRVRKYFSSILSREESNRQANLMMSRIEEKGFGFFAIEVPGVADFIGMIGLENVYFSAHFTPAIEIGWRLAFDYWGYGYATDGAKACLKYGFEILKLNQIVAFTAVLNNPSRHVMEKIGMHHSSSDDFDNPRCPVDCNVRRNVLYRISIDEFGATK